MSTLKSPWFWLLILALAAIGLVIWRTLRPGPTSIVAHQGLPAGNPPSGFAQNINAITGLAGTLNSIFGSSDEE